MAKALIIFLITIIIVAGLRTSSVSAPEENRTTDKEGSPSIERVSEGSISAESLPEYFPENLPVFPEAVLLSQERTGHRSGFVVFYTNSPTQQITKYYQIELEESGWSIEATSEDDNNSSFSVFQDDIASTIGIRSESGKTLLSITFGPR